MADDLSDRTGIKADKSIGLFMKKEKRKITMKKIKTQTICLLTSWPKAQSARDMFDEEEEVDLSEFSSIIIIFLMLIKCSKIRMICN